MGTPWSPTHTPPADDRRWLYRSAQDKLREFIALSYPLNLLRSVCNLLAYSTGVSTWLAVRRDIENIDIARLRDEQRTVQRPEVCN